MGLPAIVPSGGIGLTFGVSLMVTGTSAGLSAFIALVVFGAVESIRHALWKRETVATVLEAKLFKGLFSLNLSQKVRNDFDKNLEKLRDQIKTKTLNEISRMDDRELKKYYYILKLGLEFDSIQECLDRIRDQAILFNQ